MTDLAAAARPARDAARDADSHEARAPEPGDEIAAREMAAWRRDAHAGLPPDDRTGPGAPDASDLREEPEPDPARRPPDGDDPAAEAAETEAEARMLRDQAARIATGRARGAELSLSPGVRRAMVLVSLAGAAVFVAIAAIYTMAA